MKTLKNIIISTALFALTAFLPSCTQDFEPEVVVYPDFEISDFSPKSASVNDQVTITGLNFGDYSPAATISFGDVEVTSIVSYTDTEVVVLVPSNAGSGPITMKVWTHTHQTDAEFTYVPGPVIESISNNKTVSGAHIFMYGELFGTDVDAVKIYFTAADEDDADGMVEAEVVAVADDEIEFIVPADGANGTIYLQVDGFSLLSGPEFFYPINIQYLFDTDGDFEGWYDSSTDTSSSYGTSTLEVKDGYLYINYDMNQAEFNRTDVTIANLYVDPVDYPILAVKWIDAATRTFRLHSSSGNYNNSSSSANYAGVTGSDFDVYYYDLSNGFGGTTDNTQPYELTYMRWITTENISTGNTCSKIEWIRNFASLDELSEFLAGTGDSAPVPTVTSISPSEAGIGETVSVYGTNFGDDASNLKVTFSGDVNGTISSVSDTQIDVVVPSGAQSGTITVTRGSEAVEGPEFTCILISNIEFEFETDGDNEGWYDAHPHESVSMSTYSGSLNLVYNTTQFVYNTAYIRVDDVVVDPVEYPIIAVKWNDAPSQFHLNSNLGYYKSSSASVSNHDGALGANFDVYYYDLTNGLGGTLTEATALEYLEWVMVEYPSETGNTGSQIKWVRHFESKEALEAKLEEEGDSAGDIPDPVISSISRTSAYLGEVVSIYGENFGVDKGNVSVKFGNTEATIQTIANTQLDVVVPMGAEAGKITVARADTEVVATSDDTFTYLEPIVSWQFETDGDTEGWYDGTPSANKENAYLSVSDGYLVLNYDWVTNSLSYNRLDLYYANPVLEADKNPILAVKWVGVSSFTTGTTGTIKFHSSLGNFNNNSNTKNYTGIIGSDGDVMYYDLTKGFGSSYTVPYADTEISYIDWVGTMKNTDCDNTKLAWIMSFASVEALEAYLSDSGE